MVPFLEELFGLPGFGFLDLLDVNFEAVLVVVGGVEEGLDALADTVLEDYRGTHSTITTRTCKRKIATPVIYEGEKN